MKEEKKTYVCICGKEYNNPQSFNAHKSHCKVHQISKYGSLDILYAKRQKMAEKLSITLHKKFERIKQDNLEIWLNEKHTCENCGKIMIEYYGSGKFCSRSCANRRVHTSDTKDKIRQSLIKNRNPNLSETEIKSKCIQNKNKEQHRKENKRRKELYDGPELPNINVKKLNSGYQSRKHIPYSEQFWKKVLDNNNIKYKQNVSIWKPGFNNYWLDFLINDNIDLEIDGELHLKEDVAQKDKIRNEYLSNLGYKIYRIQWVNPINDKNKIIVNKQIDELMQYLNMPRIY